MRHNLDLEAALRAIEYKPLTSDQSRWVKDRHVVTLRGGVFYDTLTGRGGRTATDLFMAVENIDLFTASRASDDLLHNRDPHLGEYIAMQKASRLHMPPRDDASWPKLRISLIARHGVYAGTMDDLYRRNQIYCTQVGKLAAIARDQRGRPVGVELVALDRRTTERVLGSDFSRGAFYANSSNQPQPRRAVFTADALEALAWASMFPDDVAISLASSMSIEQCNNLAVRVKAHGVRIHCCLPNSRSWDEIRVRLARDYGVIPIEASELFKGARSVVEAAIAATGLKMKENQSVNRVDEENTPVHR